MNVRAPQLCRERRPHRRALITGASSGIGSAFARELPEATDLLLTGRDAPRLEALAVELTRPGRRVATKVADLAVEADVADVAAWADAEEIDLLINNAGMGQLGGVLDHSLAAERDTVAVNVVATLMLTRALAPGMIARARSAGGRAGVVILSSTAAFSAVPFFTTYAATKAFGLSFAEGLADELRGEPIDVLALCPGATRTAFGERAGFGTGGVPGATDPRTVARDGLRALGRQTVKITGTIDQATLGPLLLPRRTVTTLVGTAMRLVNSAMGARPRSGPVRPVER